MPRAEASSLTHGSGRVQSGDRNQGADLRIIALLATAALVASGVPLRSEARIVFDSP